jgi:hypothetical protein
MKNVTLLLLLTLILVSSAVQAQNLSYSLGLGIRKTFNFNKKASLDLREQLQINPDIEQYDLSKGGDFFNEDGFWPIPDRYRDDDDDDESDDDDDDSGAPDNNGELNDQPYRISFDWRTTTSGQFNYHFFPWLRTNAAYALFFNGDEFRHTFRTELDYRPLRHGGRKPKFDLATRVLYQYNGSPDDGKYEWQSLLTPRLDASWTFKKNHTLIVTNALNGAWDDGQLEFDRWRLNTSLVFTYQKIHRFTLGYQFQQRLGRPKRSHGVSLVYEVRF